MDLTTHGPLLLFYPSSSLLLCGFHRTRCFQNHRLQAINNDLFSFRYHSSNSHCLLSPIPEYALQMKYSPLVLGCPKGGQRYPILTCRFSLSFYKNWKRKTEEENRKRLCSWKAANLISTRMNPQLLLTYICPTSIITNLANATAGILGLLLKATRRLPFFRNYSVLFCGHSSTFHSWDYSPHCCIPSKPLKNSYGPSSTKNT